MITIEELFNSTSPDEFRLLLAEYIEQEPPVLLDSDDKAVAAKLLYEDCVVTVYVDEVIEISSSFGDEIQLDKAFLRIKRNGLFLTYCSDFPEPIETLMKGNNNGKE